jgi:hypothetical protein
MNGFYVVKNDGTLTVDKTPLLRSPYHDTSRRSKSTRKPSQDTRMIDMKLSEILVSLVLLHIRQERKHAIESNDARQLRDLPIPNASVT